MTAFERVRRTQRILGTAAATHALIWGLAATLAAMATISFSSLAIPWLQSDSAFHDVIALALGVAVAGALLWRSRHFVSRSRVALWIEERVPELHYSLVTAVEQSASPFAEGMEKTVARQDIGGVTLAALSQRLFVAAAALVTATLLLYVSPSAAFGRMGPLSRLGRSGPASSVPPGSRLEDIRVLITPPAYTGGRTITLDDPSSIAALTGSSIAIRGKGPAAGLTASLPAPVRISGADGGWTLSLAMPAKPAALTLRDRTYERIIVLDPRADAPPRIVLTSPVRDTTLRARQLVVQLNATATDNIGLGDGYFEYLITTGSGEIFSARTITTPVVHFGGSRSGSISATLSLASLKLAEGDVVSMRAIAQDGNTLSGPGLTTSDTRTIRIARAGEYDSLAVEAAAPVPLDSSAMSQRMLIAMTERLVREQQKLARQELVKRSTEIGDLEDRIRKRVHEILFEGEDRFGQEQPGEPPASIEEMEPPDQLTERKNPDLSAAYNALWEAVRSLQIAEPAPALPPMRVALKALDRVRLANRLYLRGMPPKVIVDIARVRMTGREKGSGNVRTPRSPADSSRLELERRFSEAIELISRQPSNAVRAFALLQVEALSTSPSFAVALGETIDAFRRGRDATLPLVRARRALSGEPAGAPGLPVWSGGW